MALLIPDSRGALFSGLVDDARLLGDQRVSLEDAVEQHRSLRTGDNGWIVGRFMLPATMLEDLAGILIRTMTAGETPWRIAAIFGDDPARDASIAASFHAAMDPAASIDSVHVPWNRRRPIEFATDSLVAGHGVHPDVLPLLSTDIAYHPEAALEIVDRTRADTLRPVGLSLESTARHDPALLLEMMDRCARAGVPFTIGPDSRAAVTRSDPSDSGLKYGVVNLIGTMLMGSTAHPDDRMDLLLDDDPGSFEIGFAGMRWRSTSIGSNAPLGGRRDPLLSIGSVNPDTAVRTIGEIITAG